jgi:hypothetical protein
LTDVVDGVVHSTDDGVVTSAGVGFCQQNISIGFVGVGDLVGGTLSPTLLMESLHFAWVSITSAGSFICNIIVKQ